VKTILDTAAGAVSQSGDSAPGTHRYLSSPGGRLITALRKRIGVIQRAASGGRVVRLIFVWGGGAGAVSWGHAGRPTRALIEEDDMDWLRSILVGVITAAAAGVGAGWVAHLCIGWYRVSGREGASGCFFVAVAGLGVIAGLAIGVAGARILSASGFPGFFRELGLALGVTAALVGFAILFAWLAADLPPTLDGRELAVEVEVRLPAGQAPLAPGETDIPPNVTITADSGGRHQSSGSIRLSEARQAEGRWIVPAVVDLTTSDPGKSLGVQLVGQETQFFRLPLPGRPGRAQMDWSPWLENPTAGDLSPVDPAAALAVRCRVRFATPEADAPAQ
jgi:hypothetical protein